MEAKTCLECGSTEYEKGLLPFYRMGIPKFVCLGCVRGYKGFLKNICNVC